MLQWWPTFSSIGAHPHVGKDDLGVSAGDQGILFGYTGAILYVKTTPQMTRFRDAAKVCNNLATDEIDDHRIQSDYKCTSGLQNPEGKNSTLGIASAW